MGKKILSSGLVNLVKKKRHTRRQSKKRDTAHKKRLKEDPNYRKWMYAKKPRFMPIKAPKKRMKHKAHSSKKTKKKVSRFGMKGMGFGSSRQPSEQAESVKYYGRSKIR